MSMTHPRPAASSPATWPIVGSGLVALAVAMGVGRFAFTPLMPLMIRDGSLDSVTGVEWAAANYAGYLIGALTASLFSRDPRRGLVLSLGGVALTTLAMAEAGAVPSALYGALLRGAAGVFSAWSLICASSWCLAELARRQAGGLGSWIYTGVGLGVAFAGVLAWLGGRQPADRLWAELGAVASAGALLVWALSRGEGAPRTEGPFPEAAAAAPRGKGGQWALVICYGTFGFGYILPATFLPAMARELAPDPLVFGLTWPLFGLTAALSVAVVAGWLPGVSRRRLWALAQAAMALGVALPVMAPALWAVAASAVLVGSSFMVATMAGLQLARAARPDNPTPLLARMTSAFAVGQIGGPLLVRVIGPGRFAGWDALGFTGAIAALLLALTALWLWREGRPSPDHGAPG